MRCAPSACQDTIAHQDPTFPAPALLAHTTAFTTWAPSPTVCPALQAWHATALPLWSPPQCVRKATTALQALALQLSSAVLLGTILTSTMPPAPATAAHVLLVLLATLAQAACSWPQCHAHRATTAPLPLLIQAPILVLLAHTATPPTLWLPAGAPHAPKAPIVCQGRLCQLHSAAWAHTVLLAHRHPSNTPVQQAHTMMCVATTASKIASHALLAPTAPLALSPQRFAVQARTCPPLTEPPRPSAFLAPLDTTALPLAQLCPPLADLVHTLLLAKLRAPHARLGTIAIWQRPPLLP